ncbi:2-C-methyl-D-erythritol 2,4-cyclodiphosphate synthase [bacterium]|nr:2-C-methyl-D-erythritol 2,4-cyclodiphosphate synthase [bacterium]
MISYRIGQGSDLHILVPSKKFILGGIIIPYDKGFKAHSDGDVLIHAIIDSLFGALGLDDIGAHFPDNDEQYKDVDSTKLLTEAIKIIRNEGWEINNLDTTIHAEAPKLRPYINDIKKNLANILNVNVNKISVKAKTSEGVDAIGEKLAVRVDSIVLLFNKNEEN